MNVESIPTNLCAAAGSKRTRWAKDLGATCLALLLGVGFSAPADAGVYRKCKKVAGMGTAKTKAAANYGADRQMKYRMGPWRSKGYKFQDGSWTRSCRYVENGSRSAFICTQTVLLCAYRKS